MRYATQLSEMINAFSPAPLQIEQMNKFYCEDTMEYRTSDKYNSPIEDIFDSCQNEEECAAFLLLGHRGCGKSTELNRMSERLVDKGYYVKTVHCGMDLDLFNIVHSDLFILMGEALLQIAQKLQCKIEKKVLEQITTFWYEGTETVISQEAEELCAEAGASVELKGIFTNILTLFGKIKTDLKFNEETRREYRRKINVRTSEWIEILSLVSEEITKQTEGKRPIIIFEDLDKLNPEDAWKVFYNYVSSLSDRKSVV